MIWSFERGATAWKALFHIGACFVLVGCLSSPPVDCCKQSPELASFGAHYEALRALEASTFEDSRSDTERMALLSAYHDTNLRQAARLGSLRDLSDDDLIFLYRATQLVAFYSRDDGDVGSLVKLLDALESRGLAGQIYYSQVFAALVSARRFEEARKLLNNHPVGKATSVPELQGQVLAAEGPTVLEVGEGDVLKRHKLGKVEDGSIVVIAHPSCHFTKAAAEDIAADPELREIFAKRGLWIAPQDHTVDFEVFRSWNHAQPHAEISVAYKSSEFPLIEDWSTPTFYFFKDGRVIEKIVGWPGRERGDELMSTYRRLFGNALADRTR